MDWRRFHDFTNHHPDKLGGRSDDAEHPQSMDPDRKPHPFKEYEGATEAFPLADRVETWVSEPPQTSGQIGLGELSRYLLVGAGAKRYKNRRLAGRYFRTYASAGALHPNEVYVASAELDGLPEGLFHFDPKGKQLTRTGRGDPRPVLSRATGDRMPTDPPVVFVVSGIPWRTAWKYGPRGYRHLWWDAGMILANLIAIAESSNHPYRVFVNFVDALVNDVLDMDGRTEMALVLMAIGESIPSSKDEFESLRLKSASISDDPYEFREITEVHAATSLKIAGTGEMTSLEAAPPRLPGDRHIEKVIWKRGSTREFDASAAMPRSDMDGILTYASGPIASDWGRRLNDLYVITHSIEGVVPGAYLWNESRLEAIQPDPDSRDSGQYLSLNQDLGGDGTAVVFPMADMNEAEAKLGPRSYRAAQLDGAIASGRLYLASYASGYGATGLTYFDEEVKKYFATDKEPMLEVSLGVPAPRKPQLPLSC